MTGPQNLDFRIEGRIFDHHAPLSSKPCNIWSRLKDEMIATGQADRVVLNLADSEVDMEALRAQFRDWPIAGLKEILVIDKQKNILHMLP